MASSELTTSGESDTLAKESGQYKAPTFVPELIKEKYVIIKDLDNEIEPIKKCKYSYDL